MPKLTLNKSFPRLAFLFFIFLTIGFVQNAFGETFTVPCKKLPEGITLKTIADDFEAYRRGDRYPLSENALTCKAALPILRKYALDPEPKIREIVTGALGRAYYDFERSFYPEPFKLLVSQLENFPTGKSQFPVSNVARFPCFRFGIVNSRRLTGALIERIGFRDKEFNRDEIEVLGCLSRREPRAKRFLLALQQLDFPSGLDSKERENQREFLRYALAESGVEEMERKVIGEIDELVSRADSYEFQNKLPPLKMFTNCRIVKRFIELSNDKREISVANYVNWQKKEIKVGIRDYMVLVFTAYYGREITGEYGQNFRRYTDAEIAKIYRRIESFAKQKVFTACS